MKFHEAIANAKLKYPEDALICVNMLNRDYTGNIGGASPSFFKNDARRGEKHYVYLMRIQNGVINTIDDEIVEELS